MMPGVPMRQVVLSVLSVAAAATAATDAASQPAPDLRQMQQAACQATIAAHVGRPAAEVTTRWLAESAGIASVEARDGDRVHICTVDAAGRVLGYIHPGA